MDVPVQPSLNALESSWCLADRSPDHNLFKHEQSWRYVLKRSLRPGKHRFA